MWASSPYNGRLTAAEGYGGVSLMSLRLETMAKCTGEMATEFDDNVL